MGASAEEQLDTRAMFTALGRPVQPEEERRIRDRAMDLAHREGMPYEEALQSVTELKAKPYGG